MAASAGKPLTYAEAARALDLTPPNTIHRTAMALEALIAADIANNRPLLATFVISRNRGGLPAPGFFACAAEHGRCPYNADTATCETFYREELQRAIDYYRRGT